MLLVFRCTLSVPLSKAGGPTNHRRNWGVAYSSSRKSSSMLVSISSLDEESLVAARRLFVDSGLVDCRHLSAGVAGTGGVGHSTRTCVISITSTHDGMSHF